ncbi:Tetratricopeptide repeat protein 31 [Geodia barretti]|nr:Tetratricopeptide repeat protein 31 [Geodia barretti]
MLMSYWKLRRRRRERRRRKRNAIGRRRSLRNVEKPNQKTDVRKRLRLQTRRREEEEEEKAAEDEELQDEKVIRETAEERHKPDKTDSKDKTETVKQANVVDNKSRKNTSDKKNGGQSVASKRGPTAAVKPVPGAVGNKKKGREDKDEEEEETISSEDELDYSSAFLSRAKVLAAARGPKTKDKKTPPATEKWQQESRQKKNITEQKTDTRPDPDPSDTKTKRNRFKIRQQPPQQQQQQGRNSRTANRGPGHSKLASAGINGSAPVFTASNGHDQVPAVGVVVEEEEEEDDLSPVDMSQAKLYQANIPQSKLLAGEGNRAAKAGDFEEAVLKYSEAISLYPFDHRYFGNRSFCYDYLQDYAKALTDANSALRIDINWAKGFYRRGRGLAGLKRYEAAVTSFIRALDLNPEYGEAREQLEMVQLEQLQGMGFPLEASRRALAEYHTVPAAIEAMVRNTGGGGGGGGSEGGGGKKHKKHGPEYTPVFNHSGFEIPPRMLTQTIPPKNCSLWVGNINSRSLTQAVVTNLFQKHGQVLSVRMLYERRCAFVNYAKPESAAVALTKLQGHTVGGCVLLLRYPESNPAKPANESPQSSAPPPRSKQGAAAAAGAVDECQYWRRSSGCYYGDQCRYRHLPESRGVDSGYYGDHPSQ